MTVTPYQGSSLDHLSATTTDWFIDRLTVPFLHIFTLKPSEKLRSNITIQHPLTFTPLRQRTVDLVWGRAQWKNRTEWVYIVYICWGGMGCLGARTETPCCDLITVIFICHLLKKKESAAIKQSSEDPDKNTTVTGKHFYYFAITWGYYECIYIAGSCSKKYESLMISLDVKGIWNWWGIKQAAKSICSTNIACTGTPGKHVMKFLV